MNLWVRQIFFLSLSAMVGLTGCDRELEIDVPTDPPTLVVNSLFTQDSLWRIEVSTSASPGQGSQIRSLEDAEIELWQNDKIIKDIRVFSNDLNSGLLGSAADTATLFYYGTEKSTRSR